MQHRCSGSYLPSALLIIANLLIPVAIIVFAAGFFPYKPFLPGLARYDDLGYGPPPAAPFDRLVFMVVDALRSDFVFTEGSGFEFTQSLIRDGVAMPFTAHATSPTVTMPRLKAITTGSIPSFLDVILNLDEADSSSNLASQDTWLAQMKAKETGNLVMYGDDTWLKLFPSTFDRADGTSSFFVSDFTEVDNNVTRHIDDELRQDDWNTMVLHYLGLDHIGHKAGPRSPNMVPKQREMDDIVRRIYQAMENESHLASTLLVMCGDHGMNDAGNHGASSAGETSPALVFMSPKLKSISKPVEVPAPNVDDFRYYSFVEQSDLVPTLGALLGFPVSKNNLGAFIQDFLPFWPARRDQVHILMHNARQMMDIIDAAFSGLALSNISTHTGVECSQLPTTAYQLACQLEGINQMVQGTKSQSDVAITLTNEISTWLQEAQSLMSSMASNYDMARLLQGGIAASVAVLLVSAASFRFVRGSAGALCSFTGITLLYGIMTFASSYVEEEQHFWYWTTTAWLVYLSRRGSLRANSISISRIAVVLISMRLVRGWNQTGQKFAGSPDIARIFLAPNPQLLWCLIIATYAMVNIELMSEFKAIPGAITKPLLSGLVVTAISFKVAFTNEDAPELVVGFARSLLNLVDGPSLVSRARAVFVGMALTSLYPAYLLTTHKDNNTKRQALRILHNVLTLLTLTQSRATDIPLFLLFRILQSSVSRLGLGTVEITTSSLLLQFASFFAMGGSNAISSVDLSSAYNGVSDFNVAAVGVLTFISNWAGPVWWMSATNLLLLEQRDRTTTAGGDEGTRVKTGENVYRQHIALLTLFTATSLGFVMAACTALRTHLFIWTVFSPKYLYSMAWSLGQHLVVNVGLGGMLYWLGCEQYNSCI
ncbi:alkaline-phosphatase-like protein [Xylariales sp. AK1849]|nr:alkaline-phosphatase-like protein [Xylariales sp. AK1849]